MNEPVDRSSGHLPGSGELRRLNLSMLAAGIAAFGALYSTQALMPALGAQFDVTATQSSLTVSAGTGALALAVVPMSMAAERYGRTITMRAGFAAVTTLILLSALAPTFAVLVALRALVGVAVAAVVGVAMGHVGAEVHPRAVGGAMGLYVAGNSLGGIGGRLISAGVYDAFDWRVAQAAIGLVCAIAFVVFWRNLPPPIVRHSSGNSRTVVRDATRHIRDPALLMLYGVPFLLMGGFVATYNYLTFRLESAPFDLPSSIVSLVFLVYLSGTAASVVAGRLADRIGRPPVVCGAVAIMGLGLVGTLPDRLSTVLLGTIVFTTGFFAAHSAASGWVPRLAGTPTTVASAIYVLCYYAGSSVFGTGVGVAWSHGSWPATVAAVGALVALSLVCAACVTGLAHRRQL